MCLSKASLTSTIPPQQKHLDFSRTQCSTYMGHRNKGLLWLCGPLCGLCMALPVSPPEIMMQDVGGRHWVCAKQGFNGAPLFAELWLAGRSQDIGDGLIRSLLRLSTSRVLLGPWMRPGKEHRNPFYLTGETWKSCSSKMENYINSTVSLVTY